MEASIHIGLAVLLAIAGLMILKPFLPLIAWGIIIGVASYPAFPKMQGALGGRGGLAAVLYTLILLAILIIPVVLLAQSLVEGVQTLTAHMKAGTLGVPAPPDRWQAGPSSELRCTTCGSRRRTISPMWCCGSLRRSSRCFPSCFQLPRGSASRYCNSCSRFLSREPC
jgi:hypothetical protein